MRTEGHYIAGAWRAPSGDTFDVVDPYGEQVIARCARGGPDEIAEAIGAAHDALAAPIPAFERAAMCERVAAILRADVEGFAREIAAESGKPVRTARVEAERAVSTWTFAAVEARTLAGDVVPMEASAAGAGKLAFTVREPRGVVAAITPFNFPLNLVAHKLAPALAAGCPVVLKPAEKTPLSAVRLVRAMEQAGVPAGWINLVNGLGEDTVPALADDPRVAVVSFTGSTRVGRMVSERALGKHVLLELGSNAPLIVEPDADLDRVVAKVRVGGFSHAGQSCISVQRIVVQRGVYEAFLQKLVEGVASLVVGDPHDEATDVGPMIRASEAERAAGWIEEARAAGARVLVGGDVKGALLAPTVVADAEPEMRICAEEIFAPVVAVMAYGDLDEAIEICNRSPYGLNAAIFTASLPTALRAARELRAGAVLVNESPTYRADQMPYGGIGLSGNTKEGPRYAVREFTTEKLISLEP